MSSRWIVRPSPAPHASVRLFTLPYAGGSAFVYQAWPKGLAPAVELNAIQLPGRGGRLNEPPFKRMEPMVRAIAAEVLPHLDRPFSIFGHSMGAVVGFELARLLRREYNLEPLHLFVSGCSAPQYPAGRAPFHRLPREELLRELRRLGGTSQKVMHEEELLEMLLPALRADFEVLETYSYEAEPPLGCPISAFGGLEDDYAGRESLEAWRAQTSSRFSLRMFNGDHFFLQSSSEGSLLAAISRDLYPHYSGEGQLTSPSRLGAD